MKALLAWPLLVVVIVADLVTKLMAVSMLDPNGMPHRVLGDGVRLALVYNPGAAFGLYLGSYSRWIFMALTTGALLILWRLYQQAASTDRARTVAVALVAAGAIGNLIDRIRSEHGVVDFIDVGIGAHRWPTFNIADMAVSSGAILLALVLWGEESAAKAPAAVAPGPVDGS